MLQDEWYSFVWGEEKKARDSIQVRMNCRYIYLE